jgi:hypothetical protein
VPADTLRTNYNLQQEIFGQEKSLKNVILNNFNFTTYKLHTDTNINVIFYNCHPDHNLENINCFGTNIFNNIVDSYNFITQKNAYKIIMMKLLPVIIAGYNVNDQKLLPEIIADRNANDWKLLTENIADRIVSFMN